MEYKIGTRITLEVVEVKENSCKGCFFDGSKCQRPFGWQCSEFKRTDGKNIIYKEVKDNK